MSAVPTTLFWLGLVLTACARPSEESSADVTVTVRNGRVAAPDSIASGWTRLRVVEAEGSHILVTFRLPSSASDADVAEFVAALDSLPTTPSSGISMGGPEIGSDGEVVIELAPGRYVLGCLSRSDDGHRHARNGEAKVIVVTSTSRDPPRTPPVATEQLRMIEFAYVGADTWPAGEHMIRIENGGMEDHQLRLVRLRDGSSVADWLADAEKHGTPVAGMARLGPGQAAYLPVALRPGSYVAYCLIPSIARKQQHIELGMLRALTVVN